jgi:hypothetical protein
MQFAGVDSSSPPVIEYPSPVHGAARPREGRAGCVRVRAMSCSAMPSGPNAITLGHEACTTTLPAASKASPFTTDVPESSATRIGPLMPHRIAFSVLLSACWRGRRRFPKSHWIGRTSHRVAPGLYLRFDFLPGCQATREYAWRRSFMGHCFHDGLLVSRVDRDGTYICALLTRIDSGARQSASSFPRLGRLHPIF